MDSKSEATMKSGVEISSPFRHLYFVSSLSALRVRPFVPHHSPCYENRLLLHYGLLARRTMQENSSHAPVSTL